jgi:putative Ca2+/H+ antiporter (TMEM165/GDT1 family)
MNTFLISIATVALGELGDKTQLLALLLAVRYRRPLPIIAGILASTVVNHLLAALAGTWVRDHLRPDLLHYIVGFSFLAVALWTLKPDELDASEAHRTGPRLGVFGVTVVAFFLAEFGDKTQIATALLAARFGNLPLVVAGTTLGMLLIDGPSVIFGDRLANRIPLHWVRRGSALVFAVLGVLVFYDAIAGGGTALP